MKKLILSLAIITAASFSVMAAGQSEKAEKCVKTECAKAGKCDKTDSKCNTDKKNCKDADCKKKDCKDCKKCGTKDCCKKGDNKKFGKKGGKNGAPGPKMAGKHHGMKDGRGDGHMRAFEGIDLTAEQQQKLSDLRSNRMERAKNDKASSKTQLTDEQRAVKRAEMQAKREEARKKYLEDVKGILTPEQYAKFLENEKNAKPEKRRK